MTTQQPEALRLVNELVLHARHAMNGEAFSAAIAAAAELRRQHEVNQELLAVLKVVLSESYDGPLHDDFRSQARASIAKAERTTT